MIAVKINEHFIINQLCNTAGILPVDTNANIALLHIIKTIVDNSVCPALYAVFSKGFNAGQFFFSNLRYIFSKLLPVLAEVSIKILGLIILPLKFFELKSVLSIFNTADLCNRN